MPRKQMEARHAKAMEAAEEKFRKAFDRVKRAAVEAPWKQKIAALSWWYQLAVNHSLHYTHYFLLTHSVTFVI